MEFLVTLLFLFLLIVFYITSKNKYNKKEEEPKEKQPKKKDEYTIDDLMLTLDFLLKHQVITPTQYNQLLLQGNQFL